MTNGSSQGLFVIVAVVIFGIFVAISYSIFNGSLQPALANVFKTSTSKAYSSFIPYTNIKNVSPYWANSSLDKEGIWRIYDLRGSPSGNITDLKPVGLMMLAGIKIPYNHKLYISFKIFVDSDSETTLSVDPNNIGEFDSWKGNDNHGTTSSNDENMFSLRTLKGKVWHDVDVWYANDSSHNVNKEAIIDKKDAGTIVGIQSKDVLTKEINQILIKDFKYKVAPIF